MIDVRQISKRFDGKPVLDAVSLRLEQGERAALVGHNGSGKTTLLRCLLGLYEFEGSVTINGGHPRRDRERVLAEVGFVPQTAPPLRMTVGEFIAATAELCRCSEKAIEELAAELGLDIPGMRRRPFKVLSGGMKQKLLIAAALARRPKLLLMDEPAASLDPVARGRFFELLAKLPRETVMILSSHRVDELAGIVTRMIELDSGRVTVDDVVATSEHEALGRRFACKLRLSAANPTVEAGLRDWGFSPDEGLQWNGSVAAPDRFRFLATITRWSGMVDSFHMEENS